MEIRVLGPFEVRHGGDSVEIGAGKPRALLALLSLNADRVVTNDQLIDQLWGDEPPPTATKALQNLVSQLRRALGETGSELLVTQGSGYRLRMSDDAVDAKRFERLAASGRQALSDDPARAAERLREALALWRGEALTDVPHEHFAPGELGRLEELRLGAVEDRIDADLASGRNPGELVPELEALVAAHPFRDRLRGQLMLALYRSGRQADALQIYRDWRTRLDEELGLEPGVSLRELERAILTEDPSLGPAARLPPPARRRRRRRLLLAAVAAGALAAVAATAALLARGGDSAPPAVVPNAIVKIDPRTNEIVDVFPVGRDPGKVAIVGPYVFVTSERDKTLTRIDSRTGEVGSNGEAGADAGLAAGGDRYLWVASVSRGEVTWMDAQRLVAIDRLRLDPHLVFAFLAVGGGSLWVSEYPASATSRYGLRTLQLERKYPLGYAETPVEIAYAYGAAWVALGSSNTLFRIDARDGRTRTIPVGDKPSDPAVGFGSIWVAGYGDGSLWRVDAVSEKPRSIVDVTAVPFGVAVGEGSVWVTDNCLGTVSRIDPETNDVVATIETGYAPRWLAAGNGAVWVGVSAEPYEPCR